MLDDLAQGAGAPERRTFSLRCATGYRQQGPLERLGLSGDPSPMVVDKTYQRLKAQLKERLSELAHAAGKALAKEALTYLKAAVEQLATERALHPQALPIWEWIRRRMRTAATSRRSTTATRLRRRLMQDA